MKLLSASPLLQIGLTKSSSSKSSGSLFRSVNEEGLGYETLFRIFLKIFRD